jgi:SAM-dependent methyltransferase
MSASERERSRGANVVLWHDLECGGYAADLEVWERLADATEGTVLDLGCGTGRVGLHLARRGASVVGIDSDRALVEAFNERAAGIHAEAVVGDAADLGLDPEVGLALAPMQLVQLLADRDERAGCLRGVAARLRPGARAAFAIVERIPAPSGGPPPLPDAREIHGWVYSSLPLETGVDGDRLVVRRLRQSVSPSGELTEEVDEVTLARISADELEREAGAAGLHPAGRLEIEATDDHVGSTVVVLKGV